MYLLVLVYSLMTTVSNLHTHHGKPCTVVLISRYSNEVEQYIFITEQIKDGMQNIKFTVHKPVTLE